MADFHAASREHVEGFDPLSCFGESSGGDGFNDAQAPLSKPPRDEISVKVPEDDISASLKASAKMLGEDDMSLLSSSGGGGGVSLFEDPPSQSKGTSFSAKAKSASANKNALKKKNLPQAGNKVVRDRREGADHRLGLGVDMFAELSDGQKNGAGASALTNDNKWLLADMTDTLDLTAKGDTANGLFDESEPGNSAQSLPSQVARLDLGPASIVKEQTKLLNQKNDQEDDDDDDDTAIQDLIVGKIMEREDDDADDVELFGSTAPIGKSAAGDTESSERRKAIQSLLQDDDDLERLERTSTSRQGPSPAISAATAPSGSGSDDLFSMLSTDEPKDIVGDAAEFDFSSYINSQGADATTDSGGGVCGGGLFS
mmetsp:Transcript_51256/g.69797  ORF Transcript_51256/g.69797 Transcript_51256/m.69797 type:complete len:371 (-) Transcript_51256:329-1441(-)|eukprot:CAMPEP_0185774892 /NCGR_PEP_ID=MMETSP1174-20130828/80348_1 /TAXON_ID=35687 /ORGANISM="Dictyocha speculum, Strain CCMP1381" /LENGTH=370 /DNA_ID=CAMNT_0028462281 /DNA_START=129 /DNA_END=1241 /DNA_ORIENTATION=-